MLLLVKPNFQPNTIHANLTFCRFLGVILMLVLVRPNIHCLCQFSLIIILILQTVIFERRKLILCKIPIAGWFRGQLGACVS